MPNKPFSHIILLCLSLIIACFPFSGTPEPPNDVQITSTPTEIAVSPPSSPTLISLPPTPTPQLSTPEPAIAAESSIPAGPDFVNLAPYRQAMLPQFATDVDQVAAAGTSRYHLEVSLDPSSFDDDQGLTLNGVEHIRYTNTEDIPLSEIYFRLYPNLAGYGGRMSVETVLVNGQPVEPTLEASDSAVRIPLNFPLEPGASIDLSLTYQSLVPRQTEQGYNIFVYHDNTVALAGFYPVIAVYDDEGWNIEVPPTYGDATYLDVSLYQVELTVPEQMVVAASGSLLESVANDNGTKTLFLASGPMRDFYIVGREDYQVASEMVDGTLVNSYYPPDLEAGGGLALRYAADALRVFNKRFGQYPYAEFDVAATPTTAGGVEYPGIVVVTQNIYGQSGGFFQHATAHEVAHQWWYGLVGNDQVDEPWLDESLTNYSTTIYWEAIEGSEAAERIIEAFFIAPYEHAKEQGQDRAVAGAVGDFSEREYALFVYGKGPLFFNALRQAVGDEIYFQIMKTYYSEYKYRVAQPPDLLEVIERVSGQDMKPLAEQWLQNQSE